MNRAKILKLCIVSLHSYPLFNPACQSSFGGSEVRVSLIARELARRGRFEVNMIVLDYGQPRQECWEGITFHPHSSYSIVLPPAPAQAQMNGHKPATLPSASLISWLRETHVKLYLRFHQLPPPFFGWARQVYNLLRWVKRTLVRLWGLIQRGLQPVQNLIQTMQQTRHIKSQIAGRIASYIIENSKIAVYDEVNADIYISHGSNNLAAELAFYCGKRGKKHVFLSGSDRDYQPIFKEQPEAITYYHSVNYLLVFAIERATVHIVQNEHQAQLLQKHYSRTSVVIRNPVDLTRAFPKLAEAHTILWVGKSDEIKRPEIILNLARHCPEYHFMVIMTLARQDTFEQSVAQARELPNVTILPYVPYQEVERYFAEAKLFVNTSVFEGFPNTFLQATKYEVPIVSLQVDPGEILSRHGCGLLCAGDFEHLKENVRRLMITPALYAETSARCLEYVRTYHNKDTIIAEYESILASIPTPLTARLKALLWQARLAYLDQRRS